MPQRLDGPIHSYADRIEDMVRYVDFIGGVIGQEPKLAQVLTESSFVLSHAYYEDFLRSLLSRAARYRQPQLRKVQGIDEIARRRLCYGAAAGADQSNQQRREVGRVHRRNDRNDELARRGYRDAGADQGAQPRPKSVRGGRELHLPLKTRQRLRS